MVFSPCSRFWVPSLIPYTLDTPSETDSVIHGPSPGLELAPCNQLHTCRKPTSSQSVREVLLFKLLSFSKININALYLNALNLDCEKKIRIFSVVEFVLVTSMLKQHFDQGKRESIKLWCIASNKILVICSYTSESEIAFATFWVSISSAFLSSYSIVELEFVKMENTFTYKLLHFDFNSGGNCHVITVATLYEVSQAVPPWTLCLHLLHNVWLSHSMGASPRVLSV